MLHFEEVCSNLKRCAPGAVTAATEGGTGGREGMGASKNEEEATCQEQLLCSCSFAFVFPFYDFVVFICVSFYICLWFTFSLSFQQERKKRIARVAGAPTAPTHAQHSQEDALLRSSSHKHGFLPASQRQRVFFQKGTRVRRV